jgi:iron complex transport system permease protein
VPTTVIIAIARRAGSGVALLIIGVMVGAVVSAVVSLILVWHEPQFAQQFVLWGLGSFDAPVRCDLGIVCGVVGAGLLLAAALAKPLNALLLGESSRRAWASACSGSASPCCSPPGC